MGIEFVFCFACCRFKVDSRESGVKFTAHHRTYPDYEWTALMYQSIPSIMLLTLEIRALCSSIL